MDDAIVEKVSIPKYSANDRVIIETNDNGETVIKLKTIPYKIYSRDMLYSRAGQMSSIGYKLGQIGTVGNRIPRADIPFSKEGMFDEN
ncbi:hypothetical protein QLL95_gp0240 [Cotonvirus japonicus]|uniref:Uncharacterized protein n=1 Tax=Cotonvirus japonicus TaxID=2811091 RepID=A0ABM7NRE5_9VIRU|nr:hypothetical protein QLL95_gp0240 [Cotonvirus japonicus]BCS82729.1 hypothetical protein [Cotonvirus japonicus]